MIEETDERWFRRYPRRLTRVRLPHSDSEAVGEFASLGVHDVGRRRMLVLRVPDGVGKGQLLTIPYLLFGDEALENEDRVLLPIIHEVMVQGARDHWVPLRRR